MRYLLMTLVALSVLVPAVVVEAGREPIDVLGYWSGPTVSKIKVNREGRDVDPYDSLVAGFGADGSWAAVDAEKYAYEGTYERKGRKTIFITLKDGAGGTDSVRASIAAWIEEMAAEDYVELTDLSITLTKLKLKARARETKRSGRSIRVTNLIKFTATAHADGEFITRRGWLKSRGTLTPATL